MQNQCSQSRRDGDKCYTYFVVFRWRRIDKRMKTWQSSLGPTYHSLQVKQVLVIYRMSHGATVRCSMCRHPPEDTCMERQTRVPCPGHVMDTILTRVLTPAMVISPSIEDFYLFPDTINYAPGPVTTTGSVTGVNYFSGSCKYFPF